ncbi:MAG: hypothetical protein C4321_06685 [Chloroflexota bacterium]
MPLLSRVFVENPVLKREAAARAGARLRPWGELLRLVAGMAVLVGDCYLLEWLSAPERATLEGRDVWFLAAALQLLLVPFLAPVLTAGTLTREKEQRFWEMLVMSRVTAGQILFGKLLPRLVPLGLRYTPEDHIGAYLCASVLGPWDRTPGPPLRYVLFPRLDPGGPLALEPITAAEAALELMRYSKNLRRFPRFGLDLVPRLLERVECYVLRRNDDLAAAASLVQDLVGSA